MISDFLLYLQCETHNSNFDTMIFRSKKQHSSRIWQVLRILSHMPEQRFKEGFKAGYRSALAQQKLKHKL